MKIEREHNQEYLKALDQSIFGMFGVGIDHFTVAPEFRLRPLAANEERHFVPAAEAGGFLPAGDPEGRGRSIIMNLETGTARFELPITLTEDGHALRPTLHTCGDEGPIGRPTKKYLYEDLGVRGTRGRDRYRG